MGQQSHRSRYNLLGQLVWDQDPRGAAEGYTTEYDYDYLGRLVETTFPAIDSKDPPTDPVKVIGDTARSIINHYGCCNLEWTQDDDLPPFFGPVTE